MATTFCYRLPFPPSVNTYWRKGRTKGGKPVTFLSPKAKEFRVDVLAAVQLNSMTPPPWLLPLKGRLAVHIELTAPTKRKYDVDNFCKGTLDALMHAGVFEDDEQIDELRVKRLHVEPPGCCDVTICELDP